MRVSRPHARRPPSLHSPQALPLEMAQRIADDAADTMDAQAAIDAAFAQLVGVSSAGASGDDVMTDCSLVSELELLTAADAAATAGRGSSSSKAAAAVTTSVAGAAAVVTSAGRREGGDAVAAGSSGGLTAAAFPAVPVGPPDAGVLAASAGDAVGEGGADAGAAVKRQRVAVSA